MPQIDHDEDPLQWWKENEKRFPLVAELAKSYFAIPATSVPAERIFSTAGHIVNEKRNCLNPETVDMLIFLNKNLA